MAFLIRREIWHTYDAPRNDLSCCLITICDVRMWFDGSLCILLLYTALLLQQVSIAIHPTPNCDSNWNGNFALFVKIAKLAGDEQADDVSYHRHWKAKNSNEYDVAHALSSLNAH